MWKVQFHNLHNTCVRIWLSGLQYDLRAQFNDPVGR